MAAITMLTSPSGKSFITDKWSNGKIDVDEPECFVFKRAAMKYGLQNFKVETLFDDDEYDDEEPDFSMDMDDFVDSYCPEYNMAEF